MNIRKISFVALGSVIVAGAFAAQGCVVSGHPVEPTRQGLARSGVEFEAIIDQPGPVEVETVTAAQWEVPREGLLNLDHPKARSAGLSDGLEPIEIYLHALRHPTHGIFIVDTGIERAQKQDPDNAAARGIIASAAGLEGMRVKIDTATWLAMQPQPIAGVFLTHLHLDHILGLPDIPRGTPIYAGPGETRASGFMNLVTRPTTDRALGGHAPLREWQFSRDSSGRFAGVLDVLGDGSIWALHVPGHTPGSTAYVARTPTGPVLFAGDACHTAWGWRHAVEPGSFSSDKPKSAESLRALQALAARHPKLEVRLGHQSSEHAERALAKAAH